MRVVGSLRPAVFTRSASLVTLKDRALSHFLLFFLWYRICLHPRISFMESNPVREMCGEGTCVISVTLGHVTLSFRYDMT